MLRGAWLGLGPGLGLGLGLALALTLLGPRSREMRVLRGASWGRRRQPHPASARHPGLAGLPAAGSGRAPGPQPLASDSRPGAEGGRQGGRPPPRSDSVWPCRSELTARLRYRVARLCQGGTVWGNPNPNPNPSPSPSPSPNPNLWAQARASALLPHLGRDARPQGGGAREP